MRSIFLSNKPNAAVEIAEEIVEFGDRIASHSCQLVVLTGQEPADLADDRGAVIDHPLPGAMQGLDVLLLDGLPKGIWAWRAAVQIASASLPSFFCLRTNGFTYCGLMIFT
jgi:hypothetical protein